LAVSLPTRGAVYSPRSARSWRSASSQFSFSPPWRRPPCSQIWWARARISSFVGGRIGFFGAGFGAGFEAAGFLGAAFFGLGFVGAGAAFLATVPFEGVALLVDEAGLVLLDFVDFAVLVAVVVFLDFFFGVAIELSSPRAGSAGSSYPASPVDACSHMDVRAGVA